MKKNDWLLAAGILIIAVLIFVFQILRDNGGEKTVTVTVDGEMFGEYSLLTDAVIDIGGTNRLVIKDGRASMEWADCPDQICVEHREIWRDGESIICLPNKIAVTVKSTEEPLVDGIAR